MLLEEKEIVYGPSRSSRYTRYLSLRKIRVTL